MEAAKKCNTDVMKVLLANGADRDARDKVCVVAFFAAKQTFMQLFYYVGLLDCVKFHVPSQ